MEKDAALQRVAEMEVLRSEKEKLEPVGAEPTKQLGIVSIDQQAQREELQELRMLVKNFEAKISTLATSYTESQEREEQLRVGLDHRQNACLIFRGRPDLLPWSHAAGQAGEG